jgi:hypothetical protein
MRVKVSTSVLFRPPQAGRSTEDEKCGLDHGQNQTFARWSHGDLHLDAERNIDDYL